MNITVKSQFSNLKVSESLATAQVAPACVTQEPTIDVSRLSQLPTGSRLLGLVLKHASSNFESPVWMVLTDTEICVLQKAGQAWGQQMRRRTFHSEHIVQSVREFKNGLVKVQTPDGPRTWCANIQELETGIEIYLQPFTEISKQ